MKEQHVTVESELVIGRLVDTEIAREWPGHEPLPQADWTLARNHQFLRQAEARRIYVASPVVQANLVDERGALTLFGFELLALEQAGFWRRGARLHPPPRDPFGDQLLADPVGFYRRIRQRGEAVPELVEFLRYGCALVERSHPALAEAGAGLIAASAPYAPTIFWAHQLSSALDGEARVGEPELPMIYGPKAGAELEPLVALFPEVVLFPTLVTRPPEFFNATRVVPVHPLGLVGEPLFSDGARLSPREYFLHDVDHGRFLVREELLSRGLDVPDAYRPGADGVATTLDEHGGHRTIIERLDRRAVARAMDRPDLLQERERHHRSLSESAARLAATDARALALLLFELLHEKGFPFDRRVLTEELRDTRHVDKLAAKWRSGFYGDALPLDEIVVAALPGAHVWLKEQLA